MSYVVYFYRSKMAFLLRTLMTISATKAPPLEQNLKFLALRERIGGRVTHLRLRSVCQPQIGCERILGKDLLIKDKTNTFDMVHQMMEYRQRRSLAFRAIDTLCLVGFAGMPTMGGFLGATLANLIGKMIAGYELDSHCIRQSLPYASAEDLADTINDLNVLRLGPVPTKFFNLFRVPISYEIDILKQALARRKEHRPIEFILLPDGAAPADSLVHSIPEEYAHILRDKLAKHKLSRFLINVNMIRLIRWNKKSCFVFFRRNSVHSGIAFPLDRLLQEVIDFDTIFDEALSRKPILAVGFDNEEELRSFPDASCWQEKKAFEKLGIEVAYIGHKIKQLSGKKVRC